MTFCEDPLTRLIDQAGLNFGALPTFITCVICLLSHLPSHQTGAADRRLDFWSAIEHSGCVVSRT